MNIAKDLRYNIDTYGKAECDKPDGVHYATCSYSDINAMLNMLDLRPRDVFVDVGCGKGRVVCMAAMRKVKKVIGIECMDGLAAIAGRNVAKMRGKLSPVEIYTGWAETHDYSDATIIYMFNPFEANILEKVLHKIRRDRKGFFRIMFVQESDDQHYVFSRERWLTRSIQFVDKTGHPVSIYRNNF